MRRNFALVAFAVLVSTEAAQACGPKCGFHRRPRPTARCIAYAHPTPQAYSYATATPQASALATTATASPAPAVVPAYEYPTQPTAGEAYYYTYDDSGKLIIQQWGDWLFRGGKEAGMPRPPLPIVGYLQRR